MTDKLKNCPICGCGAIYETSREDSIVDKIPQLFCNGCKMTFEVENDSPFLSDTKTFEYLKEKLHTTWNTRKPMEQIVEQLEELREATEYGGCPDGECLNRCEKHYMERAIAIVKGVQNE